VCLLRQFWHFLTAPALRIIHLMLKPPVLVFLGHNCPADPFDDHRTIPFSSCLFCNVLFNTLRKDVRGASFSKKCILPFTLLLVQKVWLCRGIWEISKSPSISFAMRPRAGSFDEMIGTARAPRAMFDAVQSCVTDCWGYYSCRADRYKFQLSKSCLRA